MEPGKLATIAKMRALGYSQREIAEEIGVSQPSVAYQLRKLKRMSQKGSKDEVLSKVFLGGFVDSLSGSALARFVGFSVRDDPQEVLSPDTFEDAI
jgi:transcriptional regulator with XRE-family HTH domain